MSLIDYAEVALRCGSGRRHILLGNGFSIECDPVFRYPSLYGAAVDAGLSSRAQQLFDRIGTNNFEAVMRLLDDAHWVATVYGVPADLVADLLADLEIVKRTLVEAVTSSHLAHVGEIAEHRKDAARSFLQAYHNVFTTNYDLLPYWISMHGGSPAHQDGFRSDDDVPDAPFVVFSQRLGDSPGLFYLHGGLHFFIEKGTLCKHCWCRTGQRLTDLIRAGLQNGTYPLFVAEGAPEKKLEQIERVGYLWYALDKFSRIQGPLVVFGHSLGPSDGHICNAIADNLQLGQLFVGLHGSAGSEENLAIQHAVDRIVARREERLRGHRPSKTRMPLTPTFYSSDSARPWG